MLIPGMDRGAIRQALFSHVIDARPAKLQYYKGWSIVASDD